MGSTDFLFLEFGRRLSLQGRSDIESLWGFVVGIVADYLFGMINAFLIRLVLEWRGTKYYWLKGNRGRFYQLDRIGDFDPKFAGVIYLPNYPIQLCDIYPRVYRTWRFNRLFNRKSAEAIRKRLESAKPLANNEK